MFRYLINSSIEIQGNTFIAITGFSRDVPIYNQFCCQSKNSKDMSED